MTALITTREVTFRRPFALEGLSSIQPPGTYAVETVVVFDNEGRGCRRTATFIHLKRERETVLTMIDPRDLERVLARDAGRSAGSFRPSGLYGANCGTHFQT